MDTKDRNNFVDYILGIALIFIFSWNPNFAHGYLVGLDEGQQLAWISEILKGKVVYRDIYMFYGPLLEFIPIIFIMKIVGVSLSSLRLFYLISKIATLIAAFLILKLIIRRRIILYMALLVLIVTQISNFWATRWGGPRLLFSLISLYFLSFYFKRENKCFLLISGIFSGIAFFISQEIGMFSVISIILSLLLWGKRHYKKIDMPKYFSLLFRYVSGFLIVALPIILYLIIRGAFLDYVRINFGDLIFKYTKVLGQYGFNEILFKNLIPLLKAPLFFISYYFIKFLLISLIYITLIIYFSVSILFDREYRNNLMLMPLLFLGLGLLLTAFRQIVGEQLVFYMPLAVMLSFAVMERILDLNVESKSKIKQIFTWGVFFVLIINLSIFVLLESITQSRIANSLASYLSFNKPIDKRLAVDIELYHSDFRERSAQYSGRWQKLNFSRAVGVYLPQAQAETFREVVDFIEKNTKSDESIFVFPHEGQYYFFTDRPSITRFTPTIYSCIDINYQKEVVGDLKQKKPHFVIYVRDAFVFTDYNKIPNEVRLNLIFDYIKNNYYIKRQIGETFILERLSFLK